VLHVFDFKQLQFCLFSCFFPLHLTLQASFRIRKLNILPLVIYMVRDYSFFGSTADFVIKKEHLGFPCK
jgi:hypothetical protein